jgi:hypothetical protein
VTLSIEDLDILRGIVTSKARRYAMGVDAISDAAVETAKIANEAVTADKLADEAVTADKIESEAVTTAKIAALAVTVAKTAVRVFNAQTGTTFTPAITDLDNTVTLSNAAAITVTLPQDSAVAIPVGRWIDFIWLGVGQPTFEAGAGATVNSPGSLLAIAAKYDTVRAFKRAANTWILSGPLA